MSPAILSGAIAYEILRDVGDIDLGNGTISITKSRNLGEEPRKRARAGERSISAQRGRGAQALQGAPRRRGRLLFQEPKARPDRCRQWRKDYWYAALRAKEIREGDFYCTRHTFISVALTAGENIKAIAEQCGTSAQMIEHYGRYTSSDFGQRLMAE